MMPEPSHQHDYFIQAVKENDVTGIINALSNDVFDVNFRDVTHDLETPLMRLCHSGVNDEDLEAVLEVLERKSPNVNLQDAVGRTLIMHACIALRHPIVVFSLAHGCDPSTCDRMGRSAYHYAAESGSDWIIASLLKLPDAQTCLKVLDFKGYSPTDLARHRKAHSVVKMISQAMSSSDKNPNPRPLNPKPLQPAFMRNTNHVNQSPSKRQVSFNPEIRQHTQNYDCRAFDLNASYDPNHNIGLNSNSRLEPKHNLGLKPNSDLVLSPKRVSKVNAITGDGDSSSAQSKNEVLTQPSDRWEEMEALESFDASNENTNYNDNGADENSAYPYDNNHVNNYDDDDDDDDSNSDDDDDNNLTQNQPTVLSPLKTIRHSKQNNADKLESFTSNTPMGLIKPRPLPRLLTNPKNGVRPCDNFQDNNTTSYNNDNNNIDEVELLDQKDRTPAETPRQPNTKQTNNIFTLRPPPPPSLNNASTNRSRIPAVQGKHPNRPLSENFNTSQHQSPSNFNTLKENCISPRSPHRGKISLDLAIIDQTATSSQSQNDSKSSPQRQQQLGPVVSPRKNHYPNGRKVVNEILNQSTHTYNQLKTKFANNDNNFDRQSSKLSDGNSSNNSSENSDTQKFNLNQDEATSLQKQRQQQIISSEANSQKPRTLPCRISAAGRRDLEAILSPVPRHKPLLLKRKQVVDTASTIKAQCDSVRDSYTVVKDKIIDNGATAADKENLFEEEIFLKSDNGKVRLGLKKTKEEEIDKNENDRSGSRLTIRRSSLSLPDLRDMTGCLVTSQKTSKHGGLENIATPDSSSKTDHKINKDIKKNDDDENNDNNNDNGEDYEDDDDDDDDKAEMNGDKSDDDDVDDCDLDNDVKNKNQNVSYLHGNIHHNKVSKGGYHDSPLPSIQITNDAKSSFPSSKSRGMAVPWM